MAAPSGVDAMLGATPLCTCTILQHSNDCIYMYDCNHLINPALRKKEEETKEIEEKMRQAEEEAKRVEEERKRAEEERKKFEAEKAENEAAVRIPILYKLKLMHGINFFLFQKQFSQIKFCGLTPWKRKFFCCCSQTENS